MICDYQNIYDYCLNKFSYQYATTPVSSSGDLVTSVIRTDKDTGEIITISPDSNLYVLPCDNNDIVEVMSVWECYEIYVGNNKIVSQPSLVTLNTIQKEDAIKNYDNNLQDGVTIKIDSYNTIILDGKIENQIHLGNVICLANILYNEDANSVMPYILDINNIAYYLNYSTLKNILTKYFQKVSNQKIAKDDLLNQLETIKTSDDISNKYYCNEKVSKNILKENTVIDYSTYKEVSVLPPNICDPPCDPNSCLNCENGNCVDQCADDQCCNNGICEQCECTQDNECNICEANSVVRNDYLSWIWCNGQQNIGNGCIDCQELASLCATIGGTYGEQFYADGKQCGCFQVPSVGTTLGNCDNLETVLDSVSYDFMSGVGFCCQGICEAYEC